MGTMPVVREIVADLLFQTGLTRPSRAGRDRLTVVTFHRVLPDVLLEQYPLGHLVVTVEELAFFLDFFRNNFRCGTLSEAHGRWQGGERPTMPFLAVTFDDGQRDNFEHALPVLEAAGVKATFFCPVDAIDRRELLWHDRLGYSGRELLREDRVRAERLLGVDRSGRADIASLLHAALRSAKRLSPADRLDLVAELERAIGRPVRPAWDGPMTWNQLRVLVRAGHEVGSHSLSHAMLAGLGDEQLHREVGESKARLESELGVDCESFSYPDGNHDDRVVSAVRSAGYRRAVTTAWGPNDAGADPLRLSRCEIAARYVRGLSGGLSEARLAFRVSPLFADLHK